MAGVVAEVEVAVEVEGEVAPVDVAWASALA